MDISKVLADAASRCSPPNYSGLAHLLEVQPSAVSNWRHGRALPDVVACEKIANLLGIKPISLISAVNEQREISRDAKAVWRRMANAAAVVLATGMAAQSPASAAGFPTNGHGVDAESVCIMRNAFGGQEGGCRALSLPDRETFAGSA